MKIPKNILTWLFRHQKRVKKEMKSATPLERFGIAQSQARWVFKPSVDQPEYRVNKIKKGQ